LWTRDHVPVGMLFWPCLRVGKDCGDEFRMLALAAPAPAPCERYLAFDQPYRCFHGGAFGRGDRHPNGGISHGPQNRN